MTPFSINGRVIYISNIIKVLLMSDEEFDEEYKDLIASDLAEDIENPFASPPSDKEEDDIFYYDFLEFEEIIRQKMS